MDQGGTAKIGGLMRVLVTGSRDWRDVEAIRKALWWLRDSPEEVTVVYGDAPGADTIADRLAKEFGYLPAAYPAKWRKYGRAAGPRRNQQMVDSQPDVVLAFHEDLSKSKGTKDCVKKARAKKIPVFVWPETDDWYAQWKLTCMKPLFPKRG